MKSIAKRWKEVGSAKFLISSNLSESNDAVYEWLQSQPENSKTFTLAEVEQIARQAVGRVKQIFNPSTEELAGVDFNENWWEQKKKELGV